jgi:hypothetical protein
MAISTATVGVVGLVVAIGVFLSSFLRANVNSREPPVIHHKVPFVGHIIGMLTEGPLYLKRVRCVDVYSDLLARLTVPHSEACKHPIFTLPMLGGKNYIVTDPVLAVAVQRAIATLDFDEVIVQFTPRLVGLSQETENLLRDTKAKEEGRIRLTTRAHDVITPSLAAHKIAEVSQKQLDHFSDSINNIKNGEEFGLYKMVISEVVAASMHSFYGPQNPFVMHPELVDKYWDWDDGSIGYAIGFLPEITARKAYYAMESCCKALSSISRKDASTKRFHF